MPGGTTCAVAICKNNSKIVKQSGEPIRFFSFPKDPNIRTEWIRKCFRKHEFSVDHARICSKHFKSDDFEDSLHAKLLNFYPKKLNKNAIPSLLLCNSGMVHTQKDSEDSIEMALKNEIKNESLSIDDDESLAEEAIKIFFLEEEL
ncbi:THAP domain-containing protein 2-like isoform X2 [Sitophilus oryzae]|nr:THAP domain-containing protein 2-like isoform X2 [Sitophilus oryzae]XP_030757990.1 THAP domain-containing protein 2-like isoform X2 [Sitophilus oryzae]